MILNIPDIVYEVVQFLDDKRDLARCSLLSSVWQRACTPLIWKSVQLPNQGASQCLTDGLKTNGVLVRNLHLVANPPKTSDHHNDDESFVPDPPNNTAVLSYENWKLAKAYCIKLHSLAVPFSTNKNWNRIVTAMIRVNPFIRVVTIYERLPVSEPSAAPWFVCESSLRKHALSALVRASPPETQFILKLSSTYSFELSQEFYGIDDSLIHLKIYTSHFNPSLLENEGMGDNIRAEYIDFQNNAKSFRQQVGNMVELFIDCDGNNECACRKAAMGGFAPMNNHNLYVDDGMLAQLPLLGVDSDVDQSLVADDDDDDDDDLAFITPLILPIPVIQAQLPLMLLSPPPPPPPTEADDDDDVLQYDLVHAFENDSEPLVIHHGFREDTYMDADESGSQ
ncbi:hypothetical protein SeLEV6574_g03996 [Synchytrium endobioticum]|nr:hypothetical protein SeLEV6574_g03996 [Synchytrium endobioticum]